MNRLLVLCILFGTFSLAASAQQGVYSGIGGYSCGYIYEDAELDDGTRFIISDANRTGSYLFSLCLTISPLGETKYSIAVESEKYIPLYATMVFVFNEESQLTPVVLKSAYTDQTAKIVNSMTINPLIFMGKGGGLSLVASRKEKISEISYAVFDISEEQIVYISTNKIKSIRISSRSKYNKVVGYPLNLTWLSNAKENVDNRAKKSVNLILEDLDYSK